MSNKPPFKSLLGAFTADRSRIKAAVRRRLGSAAAAEDVLQDTWLKLAAVGSDGTSVDNVPGFVHRVAQNAAIDHLRREQRRATLDEEARGILWGAEADFSPERVIIGRQALAAIEEALDALPEQSRRIFLMNRRDGCTHREIATRVGLSETAVYYHIRRVLERLAAVRDTFSDY